MCENALWHIPIISQVQCRSTLKSLILMGAFIIQLQKRNLAVCHFNLRILMHVDWVATDYIYHGYVWVLLFPAHLDDSLKSKP